MTVSHTVRAVAAITQAARSYDHPPPPLPAQRHRGPPRDPGRRAADHRGDRRQPRAAVPLPYGDASARTIAIAYQAGYIPVRWTVDTLGWEGTAGHITASVVTARVLAALQPGEIVLMHVGSNPDDHTTLDADALPHVISELRARGYSFATLNALVS